jgi:uncharacterized Zn finger protein (UPF0148 family)
MGIGERLLRGWTLMAECCPRCVHTPLVKSRQGEMYCVGCEMDVKREGTLDMTVTSSPVKTAVQTPGTSGLGSSRLAASAPPGLTVPQRALGAGALASPMRSYSPLKSLADPSKASSAIAQKLLLGWTLLGETCPVDGCLVPLMLDPKTAVKVPLPSPAFSVPAPSPKKHPLDPLTRRGAVMALAFVALLRQPCADAWHALRLLLSACCSGLSPQTHGLPRSETHVLALLVRCGGAGNDSTASTRRCAASATRSSAPPSPLPISPSRRKRRRRMPPKP